MIEIFLKIIVGLGISCFVFQFILIPGMIWNIGWLGYMIFSLLILLLSKKYKIGEYLRFSSMLLAVLVVIDLGWNSIRKEKLIQGYYDTKLKIMTYNLSFRNQDMDSSCMIIEEADPDILFIQELTPEWSEKLSAAIGSHYPYQEKIILERSRGIGIYSKFRIRKSKVLNNSSGKPYAQIVELSTIDSELQLINVHLSSPHIAFKKINHFVTKYYNNYQTRKSELKAINGYADKGRSRFDCQIFVGDFNTLKYEPIFKQQLKKWVDAFDHSGNGFGFNFPNWKQIIPLATIDYILLRGNVKCLNFEVMSGGGSDHLALLTEIYI